MEDVRHLAELGDDDLRARAQARFEALRSGSGGTERAIVFGTMGFYADPIRPGSWRIPEPHAVEIEPRAPRFVDATAEAGLDDEALRHGGSGSSGVDGFAAWATSGTASADLSGGVAAVDHDLDGDADVDVVFVRGVVDSVTDADSDGEDEVFVRDPNSRPLADRINLDGDGDTDLILIL